MNVRRRTTAAALPALLVLSAALASAAPLRGLDFYFIDTEGGAATLIVTPSGESVLVDTGNPGERDAARIARVAREVAGLRRIDHLITTHWHSDHFGGVARLVELIPVGKFYDHGVPDPLPPDINAKLLEAYRRAAGARTTVLRPGDEVRLRRTRGTPPLRLRVLAAGGDVTGRAPGEAQAVPCGEDYRPLPEDKSDNARSVVFLLSFGDFRFFDGGDLTWNVEHKLACPRNVAGRVDVFQVNHHGLDNSNNPSLVRALDPRVAVINNGARKGGQARTFATLRETRARDDVFQLHRNVLTGAEDNAPLPYVANDAEDCRGEFIKLSVAPDGKSYTVTVPAKGTRRTYRTGRQDGA